MNSSTRPRIHIRLLLGSLWLQRRGGRASRESVAGASTRGRECSLQSLLTPKTNGAQSIIALNPTGDSAVLGLSTPVLVPDPAGSADASLPTQGCCSRLSIMSSRRCACVRATWDNPHSAALLYHRAPCCQGLAVALTPPAETENWDGYCTHCTRKVWGIGPGWLHSRQILQYSSNFSASSDVGLWAANQMGRCGF
jgi:hypothetical protein